MGWSQCSPAGLSLRPGRNWATLSALSSSPPGMNPSDQLCLYQAPEPPRARPSGKLCCQSLREGVGGGGLVLGLPRGSCPSRGSGELRLAVAIGGSRAAGDGVQTRHKSQCSREGHLEAGGTARSSSRRGSPVPGPEQAGRWKVAPQSADIVQGRQFVHIGDAAWLKRWDLPGLPCPVSPA